MSDTTTDLQTYVPPAGQPTVFSGATDVFETAQRMARALCTSTMVPDQYRGEGAIGNCLVALDLAQRLRVSPLMLMQNLAVIHGRPSFASAFLIGTVNSSGKFSPLRFDLSGDGDERGCVAVAKDLRSGEILRGTRITIAMAKAEGWYGKNGSKWKTMPDQMLCYRAAAFWCRLYAPEASYGSQTQEEFIDIGEVVDEPKPKATIKRKVEAVPLNCMPSSVAEAPAVVVDASAVVGEVSDFSADPVPAAEPTDKPEPPVTASPQPQEAPANEQTLLERCEAWLEKTGIPWSFAQGKLADIEAFPNASTRALDDLSDKELTIVQANGRSIERAWKASKK